MKESFIGRTATSLSRRLLALRWLSSSSLGVPRAVPDFDHQRNNSVDTTTNDNQKDHSFDTDDDTSNAGEQQLNEILKQLSEQETEVAARASYEYLMSPNPRKRLYFAKLYAKRFLENQNGNVVKALETLKDTLQFRTKINVDELRTFFDNNNKNNNVGGTVSSSMARKQLENQVRWRNVYVQGYDKQGRSTYLFIPRNVLGHDNEWTIKQHVYTLERAVASSRAPDKTVNAIVDFKGFSVARQAPPTYIGQQFMTTFCNHYATAIHNVYFIDAPAQFVLFWALLKPILGKRTRTKIRFVQSRNNDLSRYYEPEQAAPWMMRGGKKNRELDIDEYLYKTPFFQAFDE